MSNKVQITCNDCRKMLSEIERHYIGYRCFECEEKHHGGADSPDFDAIYDVPGPLVH